MVGVEQIPFLIWKSVLHGCVCVALIHSSTDSNFLQEVEELERQKKEIKGDEQKKDIKGKLSLKALERDLAEAKWVGEISWQQYYNY